jgi:hypothetical protein
MPRLSRSIVFSALATFCMIVFLAVPVAAADDPGIKGWEADSEYNSHYDVDEHDSFKGRFQEVIEVTPLPGMAPGYAIKVEDEDGDMVKVHLGPQSFVNMDSINLKKGDKVKVKGVWADIKGEEVFMASKVKKSEYVELKVRLTSDGTPFWTMSKEQLARELRSSD